jgi:clathrin heavy chain
MLMIVFQSRNDLPGADDLFVKRFNASYAAGNFADAARTAATSPRVCGFHSVPPPLTFQGILRNLQTIQRLQSAPVQAGQQPPLLQYFGILLESGKVGTCDMILQDHDSDTFIAFSNLFPSSHAL